MFIEERHQAILDMLSEKGSVTTSEIKDKFGISYDSAKRDLRLLEEAGKLRRTHGGAIPVGELSIGARRKDTAHTLGAADDECARIAAYAVSLISDGDVVFLPSDSIGALVAERIPKGLRVRVLTGDICIADMLRRRPDVTVIFLGGELDADGRCYDSFAAETVHRFRIDKAFVTSDALSPTFGMSVRDSHTLAYYNAVIDSSRKVIGLYPTVRVGCDASVSVCPASRIDVILTGEGGTAQTRKAFEECGVSVVVCE